jgi:hydrogenase/urease accessory protein HupE
MRFLLGLLVAAGVLAGGSARADVFRPAYLQIEQYQGDPARYDILWKVPALDEQRVLSITPVFPNGTRQMTAPTRRYAGGATVMHWQITLQGGLEGRSIAFAARSQSTFSVLLRYRAADGTEQVHRIQPDDARITIAARRSGWEVARSYTVIGIEHILGGFDHLLFVMALVLIVRGQRRLLVTVTAFTLAHSITLALATLGVITVPGPPVEAVIALSIVFVAWEVLRMQRGEEGLAARRPWLVAFGFGLLHGLGFAGALAEVGLPEGAIPLALLSFNIGVELGQLAFVSAILALQALAMRWRPVLHRQAQIRIAFSYGIGGVASFWVLERVAAF